MSTVKFKDILTLMGDVGVTDLSQKYALNMVIVLKQLKTHELLGERGLEIANTLKRYMDEGQ